jgi:hypothetical protein
MQVRPNAGRALLRRCADASRVLHNLLTRTESTRSNIKCVMIRSNANPVSSSHVSAVSSRSTVRHDFA